MVNMGRSTLIRLQLTKGIFANPGVYPAVVRWGNADSRKNSDFKPDVRSMSFSVDLTQDGSLTPGVNGGRQDFSLQNAPPLPINDSPGFAAVMKVLAKSNPFSGLWSLPFKDKLRVLRILTLAKLQSSQKIRPYQQLRYWSNVPFRHGLIDVVQYSAIPSPGNLARPLQKSNPKGLQDELIRHLNEDGRMSSFEFGCQFLDAGRMTYWVNAGTPISGSKTRASNGRKKKHRSTRWRGSLFCRSLNFGRTPAKSPISM
jgi:hypothetical protein